MVPNRQCVILTIATGGGGQTGLDILSFSNISAANKNRYYAQVFVGWLFLGNSKLHFIFNLQDSFFGILLANFFSSRKFVRSIFDDQKLPLKSRLEQSFSRQFRKICFLSPS